MKKTLSVFATLALLFFGAACVPQETNTSETGDKEGNTETSNAPSVTVGADNISAVSVVLKGKANLTNSAASDLQVGFQYSKSAGILPSNSITIEADDSDANYNYSSCVTGLNPETTYYFRSIVRQKGVDEYGETKEFKTKDVTSVLQTLEADAVSAVSAKLQANLDLENVRCASNSFGFYWGSSSESLDSIVTAIEREDTIVVDLSALNPSKKYYFQAFASFDGKILKEAVKSFTTKSLESLLETKDASEIKATSASLNAKLDLTDVKYGSITYGFYWGSSESNQNSYMEGERLADHTFASAISNLSHKTQYWYKAYLRLDDQSFYGELKSFTTDVVPIESISLDKTTHTFHTIGSATTLTATVLPADATDKSVEWTTSDANVATVDQSGKVTAVGNGTATISVTTKDKGKSATCEIAVAQWVTSVSLNQTSTSLNEGQEQTLIPTVNPDNATDKSLKWTSSNDAIATVDKNGKITAVSKGSATIRAEANDRSGKYATCSVIVKRLVTSIQLNTTSLVLYRGASNVTGTLTATVIPSDASNTAVTWSSSNTSVATVSGSGIVTGKSIGTATITATAKDGHGASATCDVEVKQYVTSLRLAISNDLIKGDSITPSAIVSPVNASDQTLSWTSSNEAVVSVDEKGRLKALTKGKAIITVTAKDGSGTSASCSVVVSNPCPTGAVYMGTHTSEGYRLYWAKSNLGTNGLCAKPQDYGSYYAWGETAPKSSYGWGNYKFSNSSSGPFSKYNSYGTSYGAVDYKSVLELEDDVANVKLGGEWRIPTDEEWTELRTQCTWTWTTEGGVYGKKAGSLFLPAAGWWSSEGRCGVDEGCYWSSSIGHYYPCNACEVNFGSGFMSGSTYGFPRCDGLSIRPVSE